MYCKCKYRIFDIWHIKNNLDFGPNHRIGTHFWMSVLWLNNASFGSHVCPSFQFNHHINGDVPPSNKLVYLFLNIVHCVEMMRGNHNSLVISDNCRLYCSYVTTKGRGNQIQHFKRCVTTIALFLWHLSIFCVQPTQGVLSPGGQTLPRPDHHLPVWVLWPSVLHQKCVRCSHE